MSLALRRPAALPAVLLALIVAACSSGGSGSGSASAGASVGGSGGSAGASASGDAPRESVAPTEGSSASVAPSPSVVASPGEGEFVNPVLARDMPDPFILDTGDRYYLYATTSDGGSHRYPYATSDDLVTWEYQGSSMPKPPKWSDRFYWAPEVTETPAGFVMFYTARAKEIKRPDGKGAQCVGIARADSPDGPFIDESTEPAVCHPDLGGTIDGSAVRDVDGSLWMIYKTDGNCCSLPTGFFMRRMSDDGLTFAGEEIPVEGITDDVPWEGGVVEGPTIYPLDGTYYLFYSGNHYKGAKYAMGYATSSELAGPYADAVENPILQTVPKTGPFGPGHQSLVEDRDGDLWIAYHSYEKTFNHRHVWIDELVFEDGKPVIQGPDVEPQPVP